MTNPKWKCPRCGREEEILDPEEASLTNRIVDSRTKPCECGGEMYDLSAAQVARQKGFSWCVAAKDFIMTPECPKIGCPYIENCHRRGFRKERWI
jgi:hypothetical protein